MKTSPQKQGPGLYHTCLFLKSTFGTRNGITLIRQRKQPQSVTSSICYKSKYQETPLRQERWQTAGRMRPSSGNALGEIQFKFLLLLEVRKVWNQGSTMSLSHATNCDQASPPTLPWPVFQSRGKLASKNSVLSSPQGRSSPVLLCAILTYSAFYTSDMYV